MPFALKLYLWYLNYVINMFFIVYFIYIFLFNYYYNFGRMVTYACGFNFLSVVIAIILKWKEEE